MDDERWIRVLRALGATGGSTSSKLCSMSARVLAVSGASVTVMAEDGASRMTVCSSDGIAEQIEELQFSLGEGPCDDAYAGGSPVTEPDLAGSSAGRWPRFAPAAVSAGAAAVFAFPLRVDGVRIGVIDLYRDRPGRLSGEQLADALVVADVVARDILTLQSGALAGTVSTDLARESELRLVVHQATGMVAAQLGIDVREAMVRLRARAYADGASLTGVAAQVVNGELRFA